MQLYDFQQQDVEKLTPVRSAILANDMGTGKTVTTVVLDLEKRRIWDKAIPPKTLVVCPLGVIQTWEKHFNKWAPNLKVYAADNRSPVDFMMAVELGFYDVYIVNYAGMRNMENLNKHPWFHVILDEAHALQDRNSQQSKAAKKILAYYKTALSGTPSWHRPDDFFGILNWCYPKRWYDYDQYVKTYTRGKNKIQNQELLQHEISGFFVARRKADVLKDLPPKVYAEIEVGLGEKQRRAYDSMARQMRAMVGEKENQPISVPNALVQIGRLQQFSAAYGTMIENQLVLSDPSAKLDKTMELIHKAHGQVVVFSQYEQVIRLLEQRLKAQHITHGIYTGKVPKLRRDEVERDFQSGKLQVFAGTMKTGGQGLTLTAASRMIRIDREWVEALNEQAVDRIHRIGQTAPKVQIGDLVAVNTVDRWRINRMEMSWKLLKKLLGDDMK